MSQTSRILVVDDNPVVLTNVVELLKTAGYSVLEATTSQDCLRLARDISPTWC